MMVGEGKKGVGREACAFLLFKGRRPVRGNPISPIADGSRRALSQTTASGKNEVSCAMQ